MRLIRRDEQNSADIFAAGRPISVPFFAAQALDEIKALIATRRERKVRRRNGNYALHRPTERFAVLIFPLFPFIFPFLLCLFLFPVSFPVSISEKLAAFCFPSVATLFLPLFLHPASRLPSRDCREKRSIDSRERPRERKGEKSCFRSSSSSYRGKQNAIVDPREQPRLHAPDLLF